MEESKREDSGPAASSNYLLPALALVGPLRPGERGCAILCQTCLGPGCARERSPDGDSAAGRPLGWGKRYQCTRIPKISRKNRSLCRWNSSPKQITARSPEPVSPTGEAPLHRTSHSGPPTPAPRLMPVTDVTTVSFLWL